MDRPPTDPNFAEHITQIKDEGFAGIKIHPYYQDFDLMEISFSINYLGKQAVRELILNHSSRYVLFGTDSPWCDQEHVLCLLRSLELGQEREEMILRQNALDLLGATGD